MNPDTETQTNAPTEKRTRTKRASKPRKPRTLDEGIAAIHAETRAKIAQYRLKINSSKITDTFISKRLPKLTEADKERLMDELSKTTTPALLA